MLWAGLLLPFASRLPFYLPQPSPLFRKHRQLDSVIQFLDTVTSSLYQNPNVSDLFVGVSCLRLLFTNLRCVNCYFCHSALKIRSSVKYNKSTKQLLLYIKFWTETDLVPARNPYRTVVGTYPSTVLYLNFQCTTDLSFYLLHLISFEGVINDYPR